MRTLRLSAKRLAWLLAAVLLAAQASAATHELQHDLRQHNDASCALHLHAKQAAQAAAVPALPAIAPPDAAPCAVPVVAAVAASTLGYRTRAPPAPVRPA